MKDSCSAVFLIVSCVLITYCCGSPFRNTNGYVRLKSMKYSQHYNNNTKSEVNSSIFKTANKYICHYEGIENPEIIVYGVKSWIFPKQNVNLTLSYPPEDVRKNENDDDFAQYIITGFNVVLFVDNTATQGFITDGGILQETIDLLFRCDDITMLSYEFWVFGIRKMWSQNLVAGSVGIKHMC